MRIVVLLMVFCGVVLSGCAETFSKMKTPFVEAEFLPFISVGTGVVVGQAFAKSVQGDVKLAAGEMVELVPLTTYTRERFERATLNEERLEPRDPRLTKYIRKTVANATGDFEFTDVPPGDYLVFCDIRWAVEDTTVFPIKVGGLAYGEVSVKEGGRHKVIVSHQSNL